MFDWFSSEPKSTPATDADRGREALVYFHNYSRSNFGSVYKYTLDELIALIQSQRGAGIFCEGFGFAIANMDLDEDDVQDAMNGLAKGMRGAIPNWNTFFRALKDEALDYSPFEALGYTAKETTKDVAAGFEKVGAVTLDTLNSVGWVAPAAITAALLLILYNKANSI